MPSIDYATELVLIRRFQMIASFTLAAKHLLEPILINIDGFRPLETEPSGVPKPPDRQRNIFLQMSDLDRSRLVAGSCVVTSNLGYALEQALKLLIYIETGQNTKWIGRTGHHLPKLFKELERDTQDRLSEIYRSIQFHDFEFEEAINANFPEGKASKLDTSDLYSQLQYWQHHKLLQGSRYKYSDATPTGSVVRVLIPFRTVLFMDKVLASVLAPRLRFGDRALEYSAPLFKLDD